MLRPRAHTVPGPALWWICRCPLSQPEKLSEARASPVATRGKLGGTHGSPRHLWNGVKAGPGAPGLPLGGGGHALRQAACRRAPVGFPSPSSASPSVNGRARSHGLQARLLPVAPPGHLCPPTLGRQGPVLLCVSQQTTKGRLLLGGTLCESAWAACFWQWGEDRVEQASVCELPFQLPVGRHVNFHQPCQGCEHEDKMDLALSLLSVH